MLLCLKLSFAKPIFKWEKQHTKGKQAIKLYCIILHLRTSVLIYNDSRRKYFLEPIICDREESRSKTQNLLPAILANISLNPMSTYWGICHHIGRSAAWYVTFPIVWLIVLIFTIFSLLLSRIPTWSGEKKPLKI